MSPRLLIVTAPASIRVIGKIPVINIHRDYNLSSHPASNVIPSLLQLRYILTGPLKPIHPPPHPGSLERKDFLISICDGDVALWSSRPENGLIEG